MDGFCPKPINLSVLRVLVDDHCVKAESTTKSSHPGLTPDGGGGGGRSVRRASSGRLSSGGSREQSPEEASLLGDNWARMEEGAGPGAQEEHAIREVVILSGEDAVECV